MTTNMLYPSASMDRLRLRWRVTVLTYGLLWLAGYLVLRFEHPPVYAGRWAALAVAVLGYELWLVRRKLRENYRRGERILLPTLGWGNGLTLARGLAYGLMAGLLLSPRLEGLWAWTPSILYTLACISDYLDGYIARLTNQATVLGEILDMEFDGLGFAIAVLLAIQYGQLPIWYLPLAAGRPLFLFGLWWRERRGLPVYEMTDSANRRIIAGLHMGFVAVVLWPVFAPPATTVAATIFGTAAAASFLRDWFVVSGAIDPASDGYRRVRRLLGLAVGRWLPPAARLVGAGAAGWILWQAGQDPAAWTQLWTRAGLAQPGVIVQSTLWLGGAGALLVLAGVAARSLSLILVAVACLDLLAQGFDPANGALLAASLLLLLAGSGAGSLWQPEEPILHRRAGEQETAQGVPAA